jgi:hypothetical protein
LGRGLAATKSIVLDRSMDRKYWCAVELYMSRNVYAVKSMGSIGVGVSVDHY